MRLSINQSEKSNGFTCKYLGFSFFEVAYMGLQELLKFIDSYALLYRDTLSTLDTSSIYRYCVQYIHPQILDVERG